MERLLLYYKYAALHNPGEEAAAQAALCRRLQLSGRVLVAAEGINGTLAGTAAACDAYEAALGAHPALALQPADFKRSSPSGSADPFSSECFVLEVAELVESAGALSALPLAATGQGYLSPAAWRAALTDPDPGTVVIDVRNAAEVALGRFAGALNPGTRSFAEFPAYVARPDVLAQIAGKRVLMYCTGGVRCEKASALVRASGVAAEVRHLQGGIHRYLEAYGEDGLWQGRNFVFDRRGAQSNGDQGAAAAAGGGSRFPVGRCCGCGCPYEHLDGSAACTRRL